MKIKCGLAVFAAVSVAATLGPPSLSHAEPTCDPHVTSQVNGVTAIAEPVPCLDITPRAVRTRAAATPATSDDLTKALTLQSLPESAHTLFLDFDGAELQGTGWNSAARSSTVTATAALSATPTVTETSDIASIWSAVAAAFRPYDINVTTQDPGQDKLLRSSVDDTEYGVRAIITAAPPSTFMPDATQGLGFAFMNGFERVDGGQAASYRDALITMPALATTPYTTEQIAQAISHEVGHVLGLRHQGHGGEEYYVPGHTWGPIMGTLRSRDTKYATWTDGTYPGHVGQPQDDGKILAQVLGIRDVDPEGALLHVDKTPTAAYLGLRDSDVWQLSGFRSIRVAAPAGYHLLAEVTWRDSAGSVLPSPSTLTCPCDRIKLTAPKRARSFAITSAPIVSGRGFTSLEGVNGEYVVSGVRRPGALKKISDN